MQDSDWEDYYDTLGVEPTASKEDIDQAFRAKMKAHHPDTIATASEELRRIAGEKTKAVNRAGEVLRDQEQRRRYDTEWLQRNSPPKPVVQPSVIRFGDAAPGETHTGSFTIRNEGGPYTGLWFSNPDSWVRVTGYTSLSDTDELPLRVEVAAEGQEWEKSYNEIITVRLDNVEATVRVDLRTKPAPIPSGGPGVYSSAASGAGTRTATAGASATPRATRAGTTWAPPVPIRKQRFSGWAGWVPSALILGAVVLALSSIGIGWTLIAGVGSELLGRGNGILVGMPSELAVLQDRAGLTAYINTGRQIDLKFGIYSEVVAWDADFALGRIALPSDFRVGWSDVYGRLPPDVENIRDVHVFIHRSGWIAAYYPKQNPVTDNVVPVNFGFSLSKDVLEPLRVGLDRALDSLGIETGEGSTEPQVHYFDFSHPNAEALSLVTFQVTGYVSSSTGRNWYGQMSLSFTILEGVQVSSASWYHSTLNVDSTVYIDGKQISKGQGVGSAPSAVLYQRGIHRGEIDPKRLNPGDHEVTFRLSNPGPSGIAFFVLALSHAGQVAIMNSDGMMNIVRLEHPLHESSQNTPQSAVGTCRAQPTEGTPQTTIRFSVEIEPSYQEEFRYIWDLGDGQGAEGRQVNYHYAKPGLYQPTVRALNRQGQEVPWIHITSDWRESEACSTAWVTISTE